MKNKLAIKTVLYFILTLLPLLVTSILFSSLPEKIPMHYNLYGEIDRWGNRYESFIIPTLIIAIALILGLVRFTENKVSREKSYYTIVLGLLFTFNVLDYVLLYYSFYPRSLGSNNLISSMISLLFVFIGNFLPKLKQNTFIGIRLPWTLKNETVWYKTHRLGGFIWFFGGSIMFVSCLFTPNSVSSIVFLIGIAILILVPSVYSYIIYKKLPVNIYRN